MGSCVNSNGLFILHKIVASTQNFAGVDKNQGKEWTIWLQLAHKTISQIALQKLANKSSLVGANFGNYNLV